MRLLKALAIFVLAAPAAYAQPTCLDVADVTGTTVTSSHAMLVRTRSRDVYEVTFRYPCAAGLFPRTYFVYERWTLQPCLRSGQALSTNNSGACVIDTVTKLASGK